MLWLRLYPGGRIIRKINHTLIFFTAPVLLRPFPQMLGRSDPEEKISNVRGRRSLMKSVNHGGSLKQEQGYLIGMRNEGSCRLSRSRRPPFRLNLRRWLIRPLGKSGRALFPGKGGDPPREWRRGDRSKRTFLARRSLPISLASESDPGAVREKKKAPRTAYPATLLCIISILIDWAISFLKWEWTFFLCFELKKKRRDWRLIYFNRSKMAGNLPGF